MWVTCGELVGVWDCGVIVIVLYFYVSDCCEVHFLTSRNLEQVEIKTPYSKNQTNYMLPKLEKVF